MNTVCTLRSSLKYYYYLLNTLALQRGKIVKRETGYWPSYWKKTVQLLQIFHLQIINNY